MLPDADLIIAATAIAHDLVLETKDAHFQKAKISRFKAKIRKDRKSSLEHFVEEAAVFACVACGSCLLNHVE